MEKDELDNIFKDLEGGFDIATPHQGHQQRFLQKLNAAKDGVIVIDTKKRNWWMPLSIAASIAVVFTIGSLVFNTNYTPTLADVDPEIQQTQSYFANVINQQIEVLNNELSPETKNIITDTLSVLKELENEGNNLEQKLLEGNNSKIIISAMIQNFQTRINLLEEVLTKIEEIKNLKNTQYGNNIT